MHKSLCPQGSFEEADGNVQGIHLLFTLTPQRRGSRDMSVGPSHTGARAPGPQVRGSREGGSSMVTRKVTGWGHNPPPWKNSPEFFTFLWKYRLVFQVINIIPVRIHCSFLLPSDPGPRQWHDFICAVDETAPGGCHVVLLCLMRIKRASFSTYTWAVDESKARFLSSLMPPSGVFRAGHITQVLMKG